MIGALPWPDHHHHLAAFKLWHLLDLAGITDITGNPVQKLKPKLLVGHFPAAEPQRDLDLVAFLEEFHHRAHLDLIIMGIGSGAELDFLDLDDVLLLARFGLALLRLILVFAKIHDLADRRLGVGRDFDQIKSGFFGHLHGAGWCDHPDIFAISPNQADFGGTNAIIDAWSRFALRRGVVRSAGYGGVPSVVAS
jgi:hypothetical protein